MKRKTSVFFLLGWNDHHIFQGISRFAHEAGWRMDTRHFFLNIFPQDHTFQGMIAMYHQDQAVNAYIRKMAKLVPTVILGSQNPGVRAPMVMPDNRQVGRLAAQHLHDIFHQHYGWFACDACPSGRERKTAFEGRLREFGYDCLDFSCGKEPFNSEAVLDKLRQCPKPVGVMARDDHDAMTLLDLCHEAGISTPEEVAVIGAGDLESICSFGPIPVTSISTAMEEIGYQSAAALDKLLHGKQVPAKTVIAPGPLTRRLSTGCLAIVNPQLKLALKIVDQKFNTMLRVDDMAAAAGVSRRQLYILFRDLMRCSPRDYLMSVRLNHAFTLIADDQLHLNQIAEASGFNTHRSFIRAFHQRFGIPPSKWVKQGLDPLNEVTAPASTLLS